MGKLPAKWYHSWYHPLVPRSNLLKRKRLDGRGGGIRTPDPLLPKQMRYQAALRPDVLLRLYRESKSWSRSGEIGMEQGTHEEAQTLLACADAPRSRAGRRNQAGKDINRASMRIYQRDRGQRVCVKPAKAKVALAPLSKAEVTG